MRTRAGQPDPVALRASIERALGRDEPSRDVLPMLERLVSIAQEGTDERRFADRRLAELLLESAPWRAALHVRRLLAHEVRDDAGWALMGLAQALLGHYRFACAAYRRALALDPGNPWYSHNLGHLLDVALDRPRDAVKYLRNARSRIDDVPAITCSLAHAQLRCGDLEAARRTLAPLAARGGHLDPDVVAIGNELVRAEARQARARRRSVRTRPESTEPNAPAHRRGARRERAQSPRDSIAPKP